MSEGPDARLAAWQGPRRAAVNQALQARFRTSWPEALATALQHPLQTGGKRIRPLLVLAAHEAITGEVGAVAPLQAAVAIELVHLYSLVHDDLPAMDDAPTRRGQPTVHALHGDAAAILVGDALLTEAFTVLAEAPLPPPVAIELVRILAGAAGHQGMVGGQAADIGMGGPIADEDTLVRLHRGKTGALLTAAVDLGGCVARARPKARAALRTYGAAVGLAFQLADDLLDAEEDAADGGPPSFVKLLGAEQTRRRAHALVDEAIEAVRPLPSPQILVSIARYVVARDH